MTIDVHKGTVTLRGSTRNQAIREAVERVVFETPGVVDISNRLAGAER